MADTYHLQDMRQEEVDILRTSTTIPTAPFRLTEERNPSLPLTSGFVPVTGAFPIYELYAPGTGTTWPDDIKPQYRVTISATNPYIPPVVVLSDFPALLVSF